MVGASNLNLSISAVFHEMGEIQFDEHCRAGDLSNAVTCHTALDGNGTSQFRQL